MIARALIVWLLLCAVAIANGTFRQVALWTREDIRRIDAFLWFHGRIRRDHWVRQARTLHRRRHGESLVRRTARPDNGAPLQPSP